MDTGDHKSKYLLESRRLRLREMRPEDADFIYSVFGNPIAMRYFPRPWTREECAAAIQRNLKHCAEHGYGQWIVERRDSGESIGDCGLIRQPLPAGPEVEVGYHFHPDYWGMGYATEAARRCMTHAFDALKLPRIISLIRPENGPSRRLAERNGLSISAEIDWRGFRHYVYAMEREDWLSHRDAPSL